MAPRKRATPVTVPASDSTTGPASVMRVPLSTLRHRLSTDVDARWTVDPDGLRGRALILAGGSTACFPLALPPRAHIASRLVLLPHDWRDGRGRCSVEISIRRAGRSRDVLWSGTVWAGDRGRPRGRRFDIALPSGDIELQITASRAADRARAVGRVVLLEPTLTVPASIVPPPSSAAGPPVAASRPVISVLMPVHDPPREMLEEAIVSVMGQTYPHWELCVTDDGSAHPEIIQTLKRHADTDARIHLTRHPHAQGISTATNAALAVATGTYIALLDHDDTLTPDALAHVADTIARQPDLDMIYSDEDIVADGRQIWVHHKPAWSPDTLRTNGYTCHLGVYRRALVDEIGGFRTEFNGSQDVDMILRLTERTDRIAHIPRILYHWRAHLGSTAGGDAKPYAYVAARNAIAAHADRSGIDADVGFGPPGLYRFAHRVEPSTDVEIVLGVSEIAGLAAAARSWSEQDHPTWRVCIAAPSPLHAAVRSTLVGVGIDTELVTVVPAPDGLDAGLTAAAQAARADVLVLMQSPAAGLTHDWLTRLIGYSRQPGVAAAGPIVLSPDGRIQQAGIALPDGVPLHLLHGGRSSMDHHFGYGTSVYNVKAVSGVLATSRDRVVGAGGLDADYGELSLIDYCLRATRSDDRVVVVPDARLRTTGADPTANDLARLQRLRDRWVRDQEHDPYFNPNFRRDHGDFVVARH